MLIHESADTSMCWIHSNVCFKLNPQMTCFATRLHFKPGANEAEFFPTVSCGYDKKAWSSELHTYIAYSNHKFYTQFLISHKRKGLARFFLGNLLTATSILLTKHSAVLNYYTADPLIRPIPRCCDQLQPRLQMAICVNDRHCRHTQFNKKRVCSERRWLCWVSTPSTPPIRVGTRGKSNHVFSCINIKLIWYPEYNEYKEIDCHQHQPISI